MNTHEKNEDSDTLDSAARNGEGLIMDQTYNDSKNKPGAKRDLSQDFAGHRETYFSTWLRDYGSNFFDSMEWILSVCATERISRVFQWYRLDRQ